MEDLKIGKLETMTFKEFEGWCNERACDGCWGTIEAMACIDIMGNINEMPFWKRKKYWKREYENRILDEIVNPINGKIAEYKQGVQK